MGRIVVQPAEPDTPPSAGATATSEHASGRPTLGETAHGVLNRCRELLSRRAEVAGRELAVAALNSYQTLDAESRGIFFDLLGHELGACPETLQHAAQAYCLAPSAETLMRLETATRSPRRELFRRLAVAPGALAGLVGMREDIGRTASEHPGRRNLELDLFEELQSWFGLGFLDCRRIDWRTPTAVLEKLVEHEAVHEIREWRDLERRLDADRRCYAFFHPAWPDEPLIFTEVALCYGMPARVQPLIDPDAPVVDPASCNSAIFYSISNCHEGLRGIALGNALIRQVAEEIGREFPRIRRFATLSPVPGFRAWLECALQANALPASVPIDRLREILSRPDWLRDASGLTELERMLPALCAYYLLTVKRGADPADPVARFHLANGASLARINWLSDLSTAGLSRAFGLTVNYLYRFDETVRNHEAYTSADAISVCDRVERLLARVTGSSSQADAVA